MTTTTRRPICTLCDGRPAKYFAAVVFVAFGHGRVKHYATHNICGGCAGAVSWEPAPAQ